MEHNNFTLPSNKKFGYFFGTILLFFAAYFSYSDNQSIASLIVILAILFFIATFINAKLLTPFNKLWMSFGRLLGKIISPIVLGVIFFVLFTTYAIVMRIMGRDQLYLKQVKNKSHWKLRSNLSCKTNFKKQF